MALQAVLRSKFLFDPLQFSSLLETSKMKESVLRQMLADFATSWPAIADAYADYSRLFSVRSSFPLPFTSFCQYKGILDYILYTPSVSDLQIMPIALLRLPEREELERETALPNSVYASDHLALMARFSITKHK